MKKINSEVKISNDIFKIKVGTTDKKNPEIVYFEIGCYISPRNFLESYSQSIEKIEKSIKNDLSSILCTSELCEKDFIFVSDVADIRILKNKKSYMEIQLFVKPKKSIKCKKFSEITEKLNNEFLVKIIPMIKWNISSNGFDCYKTKQ